MSPGKSNVEHEPSELPLKILHLMAVEIQIQEGKRRILPGISLWMAMG